jgi:adsorption protein B
LAAVTREVLLFAAFGFLVGGIDDLLVDFLYIAGRLTGRGRRLALDRLAPTDVPGRIAILVPAWDEVAVIGPMLDAALRSIEHDDYRIYVGTYPNDPATIGAVASVADRDPRVRLVIGPVAGPTTKGDNLNILWRALRADDAAAGLPTRAVVLHDAEDLIHPAELCVFDALLGGHAVVQLPVHPLIRREAHWISGTYADEFAEAHGKLLVVRAALGAGLPLAGVGCAIRRDALEALAERRGGAPFDPGSLVEDYETGLQLAQLGFTGCFARVAERPGGALVATRAYFPDDLDAAVRQKARWMTGIALAGWDRTGWGRPLAIFDHWMRARDRRAPLAVLVLAAAYLALLLWGLSGVAHWAAGASMRPIDPVLARVLALNLGLLAWRLAWRVAFTTRSYGWREGVRSVPRLVVGNLVALLAVRRAAWRYWGMLRGSALVWDKTAHRFPEPKVEVA